MNLSDTWATWGNETINKTIDGAIPLSVTLISQTNWTQFLTSIAVTLIGSFGLFFIIYAPQIFGGFSSSRLSKISKFTKRNVVMIKHTSNDLFSASMIDGKTLRALSMVMNKMDGKDFDLILHTPGGEIFSSLAVSRLIKQYPGTIRAIIPLYSMSGGSLLALSCKEILMTPNASLGPIDPQLGSLFKYGSARSWEEIVKFKGKKAEDQSISFAMMGKQYTKSIHNHLNSVVDFGLSNTQKNKLISFLTDGSIEHAYPLTITDLDRFGIKAYTLENKKFLKILIKLISGKGKEGVTFYKRRK